MSPFISIVGHSKSGKTTLIERVTGELKRRGRRVAAVKHTHHDVDLDQPGKDTWRYLEAGCELAALVGSQRSAIMQRHEPDEPFDQVLRSLREGVDEVRSLDLSLRLGAEADARGTDGSGDRDLGGA